MFMVPSRLASAAVVMALAVAPIASAQNLHAQAEAKVKELSVQLQAHSTFARAKGAEGQKALQAGDTATACTHYKASRAETDIILSLLTQQREQIMLATPDAATAIGRANGIDGQTGSWMTLAGQLDQRIAMACAS
jgi:hypothetical protein